MNSSQIKGLPVVSIAEGATFGKIEEVYIDVDARKLLGFAVAAAGGLTPESAYLDAADIRSVGADAVMVDDFGAMGGKETRARIGALVTLDALLKRNVTTRGGIDVGTVDDVAFEPPDYAFTQIAVSPGRFKTKTTIPIAQVISIGPEVLVVADEALAEAAPAEAAPSA